MGSSRPYKRTPCTELRAWSYWERTTPCIELRAQNSAHSRNKRTHTRTNCAWQNQPQVRRVHCFAYGHSHACLLELNHLRMSKHACGVHTSAWAPKPAEHATSCMPIACLWSERICMHLQTCKQIASIHAPIYGACTECSPPHASSGASTKGASSSASSGARAPLHFSSNLHTQLALLLHLLYADTKAHYIPCIDIEVCPLRTPSSTTIGARAPCAP